MSILFHPNNNFHSGSHQSKQPRQQQSGVRARVDLADLAAGLDWTREQELDSLNRRTNDRSIKFIDTFGLKQSVSQFGQCEKSHLSKKETGPKGLFPSLVCYYETDRVEWSKRDRGLRSIPNHHHPRRRPSCFLREHPS